MPDERKGERREEGNIRDSSFFPSKFYVSWRHRCPFMWFFALTDDKG